MKHMVCLLLIILTVGLLATGCENEDSSAVGRQVGGIMRNKGRFTAA